MWADPLDLPGPSRRRAAYVPRKLVRPAPRQATLSVSAASGASDTPSSSAALFGGGTNATATATSDWASPSPSSVTASASSSALFVGPSSYSFSANSSSPASTSAAQTRSRTSATSIRTSVSEPWTYTPKASSTTSTGAAAQTTYVPGVVFNLSFAMPSNDQAVYAIPVEFGHAGSETDIALPPDWRRAAAADWDGIGYQTFNLQVDLGSSDLWVAADSCTSSICQSAPALFNTTASLDSYSTANLTYETGSVDGEIFWEEVQMGSFGIGYQAFVAADTVANEDLGGGNYSGVLGLSLPQNSAVYSELGGTTGSSPDGATFLDNLFGSGNSAPTDRVFALSLERYEDVRTYSTLGVGTTDPRACAPASCDPSYIPIVADPSLGVTGYLWWRVPIDSVEVTTWANAQTGTGPNTTTVTLGASRVDTAKSTPLAVLDSGGVAILVGYKPYVDAIYAAYGISASSDGYYRMPCTTQLAITFTIGGVAIPVHPLDMSWSDSSTTSQQTCVGALQYSASLGNSGDFILGSAFLKNAYSIFSYPNTNSSTQSTWQPSLALLPLINASVASQDFYAVRTLGESLASVSAQQQSSSSSGGTGSGGSSSGSAAGGIVSASHPVARTAIIAACSVVGFFVLAAAAFCAWWFYFRRRLGAGGVVAYPDRRGGGGGGKEGSMAALAADGTSDYSSRRSQKKHERTKRQMSIMDGFSDYEDSWAGTEGADSVRMAPLAAVDEGGGVGSDDGCVDAHDEQGLGAARGRRESSTGAHSWASRRSRASAGVGSPGPRPAPLVDLASPPRAESGQYADAPEPAPAPATPFSAYEADPFLTPGSVRASPYTPVAPVAPGTPGTPGMPALPPAPASAIAGGPASPRARLIDLSSPPPPRQPRTPRTPGAPPVAGGGRYDMAGPFPSARASRAGELDMVDYFSIGRE